MATPWPGTLPDFLETEGFQYNMDETSIRSSMDVGLDKIRKRYTKPVDTQSATMKLDRTQFLTLHNFYNTTLAGGVLPFEFTDPLTNVLEDYRFTTPPSIRSMGGDYFIVNLSWEKLP